MRNKAGQAGDSPSGSAAKPRMPIAFGLYLAHFCSSVLDRGVHLSAARSAALVSKTSVRHGAKVGKMVYSQRIL